MDELEHDEVQECFAAGEEAESESQKQFKGGVLDKSKEGLGPAGLGGEGKPDKRKRMTE